MKRINISLPESEHEAAKKKLPYGAIRTFSGLVIHALQLLPSKPPRRKK